MIAYFVVQNNLFMALGAVLAGIAAVAGMRMQLYSAAGYMRAFVIGLFVIGGAILGRIFSAAWANRRRRCLLDILYRDRNPEQFIRKFAPIVDRIPRNTVEYVDGTLQMAYAYEAEGAYDKGLELTEGLQPEKLKMHMLVSCGLVSNQKLRLHLLKGDQEAAQKALEQIRMIQTVAAARAPLVGERLLQCIQLAEVWLEVLNGNREHIAYIEEEKKLASNWIHEKEMNALLGLVV